MAGLYFQIGANFQELTRLKKEVDDLKDKLVKLDKAADPKGFKDQERQLQKTMSQYNRLATETARLEREQTKLNQTTKQTGESFSLFEKRVAGLAGITAIAALGKQVVEIRGQFQQLEIAFTTLLQSKTKADALMAQMVDTAMKTPFDLQGVAGGARQLLAYGFAAEDVNDTLIRLGNVASGLGLPLERLTYLYGTTRTQGRLYARDVLQFTTSGIPLLQKLADMYGVTTAEMNEMVSAGKVGFSDVERVFKGMTDKGGMFFNLMENQSKSFIGQLSNIKDQIQKTFNDIGLANEDTINAGLAATKSLIDNYDKIGRGLVGLVATYGTYKVAMALVTMGANSMTAAELAHYSALVITRKAQLLLNATMLTNPYVLAAVAIMGTVAAVWALHDSSTAAERAQKSYNERKEKAAEAEKEHKDNIEELIATSTNQALADLDRQKALDTLKQEYPKIFEKYDTEKLKLADILQLKKDIAAEDSKRKVQSNQSIYEEQKKIVKELEDSLADAQNTKIGYTGGTGAGQGSTNIELLKRQLEKAKADLRLSEADVEKDRVAVWTGNMRKLTDNQIAEGIKQRKRLIYAIDQAEDKGVKNPQATLIGLGTFNKDELEAQTKTLEAESKRRSATITNISKIEAGYKKELIALDKEEAALRKKSLPKDELLSQLSEIDSKRKVLKDKLKDIGVFTPTEKQTESEAEKKRDAAQKQADIDLKLANDKAKQDLERKKSEIDVQKALLDTQDDGFAKQKALADLEHRQRILDIDKRTQELIEKQQAEERLQWESAGVKGKFVPKTKKASDLSPENRSTLELLTISDANQTMAATTTIINDFKEKYKSFDDERRAIDKQYNDDSAAAMGLFSGKELDDRLTQIKKVRDEDIKDLTETILKESGLFDLYMGEGSEYIKKKIQAIYPLFEDVANLTNNELLKVDKAIKDIELSPELLAQLKQAGIDVEKLKKALKDAKDNASEATQERLFENIIKGAGKLTDSIRELGSALEQTNGVLGAIGSTLIGISNGVDGVISVTKSVKQKDMMSAASDGIAAVANLYSLVAGQIEENKQAQSEWNSKIAESNHLLAMQRIEEKAYKQEGIFSSTENPYKKAIASANEYKQAMLELSGATKELAANGKVQTGTKKVVDAGNIANGAGQGATAGAFIGSLLGPAGTLIGAGIGAIVGGVIGGVSKKTVAVFKSLTDVYGKIVMEDMTLNPQIVADYKKLDETTRSLVDNWESIKAKAEEARKQVEDTFTSLAGNIGTTLSDKLVDAFRNGDLYSAMDDFHEYMTGVIEDIISQMVFAKTIQPYLDQLNKDMNDSFGLPTNGEDANPDKLDYDIVDDLASFWKNVQNGYNSYFEFMKEAQNSAPEGFDLFNRNSSSSTSGGFQSMSQDTGEKLDGRFLALQISGTNIDSKMDILISDNKLMLNEQVKQSDNLTRQTAWLEESRNIQFRSMEHLYDISKNTKVLPAMSEKLDKVVENTSKL